MLNHYKERAPLKRSCDPAELGATGVFSRARAQLDHRARCSTSTAVPDHGHVSVAGELRHLLGNDVVADDEETLTAHGGDKWFANHAPEVVSFAQTTEQVSALLRFASERKIPVTARGAGYGYVGGCVPMRGGIALSLARMNRIKGHQLCGCAAVVEPGVITGDLQARRRS
jgi:hypothetical protein